MLREAPMKDYLTAINKTYTNQLEPIIYAKLLWYQTSINKILRYNTTTIFEMHDHSYEQFDA